jgi:hypothetical protein
LAASGASELAFNAITPLAATKVLQRIAESEALPLGAEEAASIAACCGGDLLNAIETLQLYGCGRIDLSLLHLKKGKKVRFQIQPGPISRTGSHISKSPVFLPLSGMEGLCAEEGRHGIHGFHTST